MLKILLSALLAVFSLQAAAATRAQRDAEAKEAFRQLNFFSGGHGMHLSPGVISLFNFVTAGGYMFPGPVRDQVMNRWGLVINDEARIAGLFEVRYRGHQIGVVGCVACHSGRAAGQYIVGLGNKNVDVVRLATDVHRIEKYWRKLTPEFLKSPEYRSLEQSAMGFSSYLADPRIGNLTQGLVPVSFIRGWFYRVHGEAVPLNMTRGQVKIPMLWGYELKRHAGQFCDGYGNGTKAGWAAAVELAAGQKHQTVRAYYHDVETAEALFSEFLPPRYPFRVQAHRAERGRQLFNRTCAQCHGTYARDSEGAPVYQTPKFIPLFIVRTDSDRLDGNTEAFNAQVRRSPLNDLIQHNNLGPGYFAPRLEGVWARFPYLHNGSVPTIKALLTPPRLRPALFSLARAGERERFDPHALGLQLNGGPAPQPDSRQTYNTSRIGHSNQGHDFYTDLSDAERTDLIEYLKTL